MKTILSFMLTTLTIFEFLQRLSGHVENRLDKKTKVNFEIYDVTDWQYRYCPISPEVKTITDQISLPHYFSSNIMEKMRQGD